MPWYLIILKVYKQKHLIIFFHKSNVNGLHYVINYVIHSFSQENIFFTQKPVQARIQEIFQRGVEVENFKRNMFVDTRINACTHKN